MLLFLCSEVDKRTLKDIVANWNGGSLSVLVRSEGERRQKHKKEGERDRWGQLERETKRERETDGVSPETVESWAQQVSQALLSLSVSWGPVQNNHRLRRKWGGGAVDWGC